MDITHSDIFYLSTKVKKKKKVENSFFFLIAYDYLNLTKFLHFAVDKILVFLLILAKVEVI